MYEKLNFFQQQYIFIYDCIRDILEKKRLREQQTNEENLYENPNVKEEDLYDNNDFIYENKAFGKDLLKSYCLY